MKIGLGDDQVGMKEAVPWYETKISMNADRIR